MSVQTNCIVIYLAVSRRQSPQSSIIVTGVSMYAFQIGVRGGRYLGDKPQQMAVEQNSGNIVGKFWHRRPICSLQTCSCSFSEVVWRHISLSSPSCLQWLVISVIRTCLCHWLWHRRRFTWLYFWLTILLSMIMTSITRHSLPQRHVWIPWHVFINAYRSATFAHNLVCCF